MRVEAKNEKEQGMQGKQSEEQGGNERETEERWKTNEIR